ncbi:hypothetical protein U1Q18_044466 [Sarracenia purpurea var. burkii]
MSCSDDVALLVGDKMNQVHMAINLWLICFFPVSKARGVEPIYAATELEKEKMEGSHLNQRSGERKMHREKSQYALFNLLPQGHVVLKLMAMIARCDLGVELPIEEVPLLLLRLHVVLMED